MLILKIIFSGERITSQYLLFQPVFNLKFLEVNLENSFSLKLDFLTLQGRENVSASLKKMSNCF